MVMALNLITNSRLSDLHYRKEAILDTSLAEILT